MKSDSSIAWILVHQNHLRFICGGNKVGNSLYHLWNCECFTQTCFLVLRLLYDHSLDRRPVSSRQSPGLWSSHACCTIQSPNWKGSMEVQPAWDWRLRRQGWYLSATARGSSSRWWSLARWPQSCSHWPELIWWQSHCSHDIKGSGVAYCINDGNQMSTFYPFI